MIEYVDGSVLLSYDEYHALVRSARETTLTERDKYRRRKDAMTIAAMLMPKREGVVNAAWYAERLEEIVPMIEEALRG